MMIEARRADSRVYPDRAHRKVRLIIGEIPLALSPGEARDLADRLHDAADKTGRQR